LAESANLDIPYPEQDLAELEKELDQSRWFYERVDRVVFVDRDSSGPPVINYGGLPTYSVCQKSSHKNYFDFILNNADKKKTKKSGEYCNLFTENSKPIFQCAIQEVGEERSLQRFFKSQAECNEIRTAEVELKSNN